MADSIPPKRHQQYIPPNQRAAIARGHRIGWVHRLWSQRPRISLRLPRILLRMPRALLNLVRTLIRMLCLRRVNDDAAKKNAELAWQELRASIAAFKTVMESSRKSFGDPQRLKSIRDSLSVAGKPPPDVWIHDDVCQLLQTFLASRDELLDKSRAIAKESANTVATWRRLVRTYELTAKTLDHRNTCHDGFLKLANACQKEIATAEDVAKKVAARQAALLRLIQEAQAIVRFFSELQFHRDRSAPFAHQLGAYRRQLFDGVSLCLRVIDTLHV